jgi:hypothetical protein
MNGVLRTALQFYTRTQTQRWLLAGTLLLFAAQLVATNRTCPCPRAFSPWPFLLAGPAAGVAAMITFSSAWDFRRISSLRTVFLIPYSRAQFAGGMFLAQLMAAAAGTSLVILVGHADALPPLAWGSPRGTFEMLFGCALSAVVLLQLVTGPSRIVSIVTLAVLAPLGLRINLFMKPEILGMPKADVLAIAGLLAWLLFAAWYVSAWRPVASSSVWARSRDSTAAVPVGVSRQAALHTLLLGQASLLRVCRQQLATWMIYHVIIVAMLAGMKLLIARHNFPANYSMAIIILLYAPVVGVNTISGCVARGSRRAWLCSGESRNMLYAIAAKLAWKSLAVLAIPLFSLAVIEILFLPHAGFDDMLFPLAICAALTPAALYLGLLNFRRRLTLSFLALYVAAAGAMIADIFVESAQGRHLLWITPVAFLAIGCVLRALARQRWCGIDWLRFRAEREKSPFAVSPLSGLRISSS